MSLLLLPLLPVVLLALVVVWRVVMAIRQPGAFVVFVFVRAGCQYMFFMMFALLCVQPCKRIYPFAFLSRLF